MAGSRFQPRQASRAQLKARVAIDGPTGSGKTFTALEWANVLQGDGRTVVIDTERGSASWYCDRWDYDVVDWAPPYDPGELAAALTEAARSYSVIIIDSFSHFWEGEGGTLDIADAAGQRSGGNSFAGWKIATPALRHLVDEIVGADAHVIATMRSKMEYVLEEDHRGKKVPKKLGLAPVMRAGVEYEFTLIADMDLEHRLVVSKSRCSALADQVFQPGRTAEAAATFLGWLEDGEPPADQATVDALVARMDALPDAIRTDAKRAFVARVGKPATLPGNRVADAEAVVAEWEARAVPAEPPSAPAATGCGHDGCTDGMVIDPVGNALPCEDCNPDPDKAKADRRRKRMGALVKDAWPAEDAKSREARRKGLVALVGGGATSSTTLTDDEWAALFDALEAIKAGAKVLVQRSSGDYELRKATGGAS